jgi:NAD(P)H-dependent FMN reductase
MAKILVILGSTRQGRKGEAVARWFMERSGARSDLAFELADLREWALPFFDSPVPPAFGKYDPAIQPWANKVGEADGYVFIMPEYNHGYPAVLKNAIDHLYAEWGQKPAAIISYGSNAAGYRAAEQLRQVLVELRMAPVRAQVGVPRVWEAFDEGGQIRDQGQNQSLNALLDELAWWTKVLKDARNNSTAA